VCSPLQDAGEINKRLDAVEVLSGEGEGMRRALVKALRGLTDVERGLSKVRGLC
jgi:DNA mismatch repair ATPase MutS